MLSWSVKTRWLESASERTIGPVRAVKIEAEVGGENFRVGVEAKRPGRDFVRTKKPLELEKVRSSCVCTASSQPLSVVLLRGTKEFDRILKGCLFQALLPKWQQKLGAPKPEETFSEVYDKARMLE